VIGVHAALIGQDSRARRDSRKSRVNQMTLGKAVSFT